MPIVSRPFSPEEQFFIEEWFDVNMQTGIIRWKKKRHHRNAGDIAGESKQSRRHGNRTVRVNSRLCNIHRVVYWCAYKDWPEQIDHIDRNPSNNSISNLRPCTHAQNAQNRKSDGVAFRKDTRSQGKWRAYISFNGKKIGLGHYRTKEEAVIARIAAEHKYYGEFAQIRPQ